MRDESLKNRVFFICVIIFIGACLFLYFARAILAPFIVAAFLTYLISPLVLKVQLLGVKRWVAVVAVAVAFIVVIAAVIIVFIPIIVAEFERFKEQVPVIYGYIQEYAAIIKNKVVTAVPAVGDYFISDITIEKIQHAVVSQAQKAPSYVMNIVSMFSVIALTPILVFFMLLGGRKSINTLVESVPSSAVETVLSVIYEMDVVLGKFIRGQLIEASFVSVMSVTALSILGVNYAFIIGITAGIANMIPYMGPFVGVSFAVIVGFIQFQSVAAALKIIAAFALIQFLDNNIVQPFVVGKNVDLGPVAMVFAMLAGMQVFGFLGLIFAVPVAAIIKTIFFMMLEKYKKATV